MNYNNRLNNLKDYIGQKKIIDNLKIYIKVSEIKNKKLDHMIFHGISGLRKNITGLYNCSRIK